VKLDYLKEVYSTYKEDGVVRIFDFTESEATNLRIAISKFIESPRMFDLSELDFIESGDISLTFEIGSLDIGIQEINENKLVCTLTKSAFEQMDELIRPFGIDRSPGKFQYLYDSANPIDFIISSTGDW